MTDFLLELLSEEIPARMQEKARADLARLLEAELAKAGLRAEAIETFATPRRLALIARGLPAETAAVREETKGPRTSAPPQALDGFLRTDDGANLLTGVRRAQNILKIEEKKDKRDYAGSPDAKLLKEPQEKALAKAIGEVTKEARKALDKEDFEGAMSALAKLRAPVDAFFDKVTVNTPDAALRENRLRLLSQIRAATLEVADFSKIEG